MINIKEYINGFFSKGTFKKNIAIMFSGTVISQGVYLLFYPILTRIYQPSDFGQYAIFIAFLSIGSLIVTGQYESSILLPKKEKNVKYLIWGAVSLALIFFLIVTTILLLSSQFLASKNLFNGNLILIILGVSIFINALYQIGTYMSLRNRGFKALTIINIINVGFSISFQYIFSLTEIKSIGLIVGYMIGTLVAMICLFIYNRKTVKLNFKTPNLHLGIFKVLKRYKNFPFANLPAMLVNLLANQMPQLLLNTFGQSIVGYFSMSQKVLGSPVTLFSTSVSHVFKERASSDYRNKGNCRPIFVKTFKSLFLISIVPFVLIFIFAPTIVPIIFGTEWVEAGVYIRALTLMYFFKFTVSPLSYVIVIAEKQKLNLLLQTTLLVLTASSLYYGISQNNPLTAVILFSISYSAVYILFLFISYKLSKNQRHNAKMISEYKEQ